MNIRSETLSNNLQLKRLIHDVSLYLYTVKLQSKMEQLIEAKKKRKEDINGFKTVFSCPAKGIKTTHLSSQKQNVASA